MSKVSNKKVIVILGPTASGKTKLAVDLAYKFNGEIISADSRQVYRGMDIGTGKDLAEYKFKIQPACRTGRNSKFKIKEKNIPYHLIDVASPKTRFNLAKYQKMAYQAIKDVLKRGKLPILVGGSGLYLQAVVDGYVLNETKPDLALRKELDEMSLIDLQRTLKKLDGKKFKNLNNSDLNNKRRLIRYIEIAKDGRQTGEKKIKKDLDFLIIGKELAKEELDVKIKKRLLERLEKEDMIGEVERLRRSGLSWKRLIEFGLEYKFISLYLQNKLAYEQMVELLDTAICQFARKQMTWFRRWEKQGKNIIWINKNSEAVKLVEDYLKFPIKTGRQAGR